MRTKAEQIAGIRADQQFWRDLAAEVGPDRYADPGPMGEWSFGDMAGHLVGWRNRTLLRLEAFSWVDEALVEVTFMGHLHDDHVPSVHAWLEAS
jgi:hypothetical protein